MPREHVFRPSNDDLGPTARMGLVQRLAISATLLVLAAVVYIGANNRLARIDLLERGAPEAPYTNLDFTESDLTDLREELSDDEFAAIQQALERQSLRQQPLVQAGNDAMRSTYIWTRNVAVLVCVVLALLILLGGVVQVRVSSHGSRQALHTTFTISSAKNDLERIPVEMQEEVREMLARSDRGADGFFTATAERYTITDESGETRVYDSLDEVPSEIRERMRKFM